MRTSFFVSLLKKLSHNLTCIDRLVWAEPKYTWNESTSNAHPRGKQTAIDVVRHGAISWTRQSRRIRKSGACRQPGFWAAVCGLLLGRRQVLITACRLTLRRAARSSSCHSIPESVPRSRGSTRRLLRRERPSLQFRPAVGVFAVVGFLSRRFRHGFALFLSLSSKLLRGTETTGPTDARTRSGFSFFSLSNSKRIALYNLYHRPGRLRPFTQFLLTTQSPSITINLSKRAKPSGVKNLLILSLICLCAP